MKRNVSILLFAVVVMLVGISSNAIAQQQLYGVTNNSPVAITISVVGSCGGGLLWITPATVVPSGGTAIILIPNPPCAATGVVMNGTFYAVGYAGPVAPPNPPTRIRVGANRTVVW